MRSTVGDGMRRRAGGRRGVRALAAGLLSVSTLAGCAEANPAARGASPELTPGSATDSRRNVEVAPASIPEVVAAIDASVVTVELPGGVGSGVVYREGGYVVTNHHVVRGASTVQLELADGSRTSAGVVATDPQTDLAVLRAEREDLPPASFQRDVPPVGSPVIAIGSPLGFQNSVTVGVLSGVGREIPGAAARGGQALVDLLQTDAAISPGNSGGALLNTAGEVIGINEAYIPPNLGAVSLGFAIPAATVIDVVDQLIETGRAQHPYLGINAGTLNPRTAAALGLDVARGVVVTAVDEAGPAGRAGLRPGDVITKLAGTDVETFEALLGELRRVRPGQSVPVEVHREGRMLTLTVTVAEQPRIR